MADMLKLNSQKIGKKTLRDFTINSIYADRGKLFDPNNGKRDLEKGMWNLLVKPIKE